MKRYTIAFAFVFTSAISFAQQHYVIDSATQRRQLNQQECLKLKSTIVPCSFFLYGFLRNDIKSIKTLDISTRNEILQHNKSFPSSVDDYLQWVPTVSLFMLDATHIRTTHTFKQKLILHLGASAIVTAVVTPLKRMSHTMRPDNSSATSFPSGHTATAFVGAEMFHQELQQTHPWLSYSGYVVATATGIYRMYNNKHWLSDVIAGAGLGILSTKCSYWIFNKIKNAKERNHHASVVL